MNSSLNQVHVENGSTNAMSMQRKQFVNVFDLMKVGLSSTLAVAIFIGIGYVVRHVAGPSAIISILIAAFIAYLVGIFHTELNTTILLSAIKAPVRLSRVVPSPGETAIGQHANNVGNHEVSSEWLLSSYQLVYICNGEFAAFVIAWNLIMEYMVIVALISKALIIFIDALCFGSVDHLVQIIPMSWYLSEYFDLLALFVPIIIGVPLMLFLRQNTVVNVISIALSLLIVVIFLVFGIFNADISNWDRRSEGENSSNNDADGLETGGFYPFGVDGVFKGVVIILFIFIAYDAMLMSRWSEFVGFSMKCSSKMQPTTTIEHFDKTITNAILSINTVIFLCLLGMAFAMTTIQPIHLMDKSLPLLSIVDAVFTESNEMRVATRFIILIAGSIALIGSLYATLHGVQRVLQMMLSTDADDSTFKLFGKFGHLKQELRQQFYDQNEPTNRSNNNNNNNHNDSSQIHRHRRRWQTCACLLFSILSGLLTALFALEHLINLLSIGTLLMLFAVTVDIMILRYSGHLKQRLHQLHHYPQENGTTQTTVTKSTRPISLVTILLSAYCLFAATLAILIKIVITKAVTISLTVCWVFISILIASLLVIVFMLGAQPKGNAIFSFSHKHPLPPAIVLFGCIYLFTAVDAAAWIRLAIWMTIGLILYFTSIKLKKPHKAKVAFENGGFVAEVETKPNYITNDREFSMMTSVETLKLEDNASIYSQDATILNQVFNESSPKQTESKTFDVENVELEMDKLAKTTFDEFVVVPNEEIANTSNTDVKPLQKEIKSPLLDSAKLNEIISVDDIKHKCVERREPNGTAYFVEMDLVEIPLETKVKEDESLTPSVVQNEQDIVDYNEELEKNMLERVLKQSEVELRPKPNPEPQPEVYLAVPIQFADSESDEEEEKEVRAIVHASNEPMMVSLSLENAFEVIETMPIVVTPIKEMPTNRHSRQSPNFQIGVYESVPRQKLLYENDNERLAFKRRLESLFSQNDEAATISQAKSNFNSPTERHSKRVSLYNQSISAPESLFDETISTESKVVPAKIPIPPAFNQQLYDTVARRNRKDFSSVSDMIDMNGTTNDHHTSSSSSPSSSPSSAPKSVKKRGNLSRTKAHENLAELTPYNDDDNAANIKQKLEKIFSKGRTKQVANDVLTNFEQNNGENVRRSKRLDPFDTVRKQKMLFSDVLKSIGPDIYANLHPTYTTSAIDTEVTQQRRESLD